MAEYHLGGVEEHGLVTFCVNRVFGASMQVCTVKESGRRGHIKTLLPLSLEAQDGIRRIWLRGDSRKDKQHGHSNVEKTDRCGPDMGLACARG